MLKCKNNFLLAPEKNLQDLRVSTSQAGLVRFLIKVYSVKKGVRDVYSKNRINKESCG